MDVSIPEEGLSGIGLSERREGIFPEVGELGGACWCNIAEVELDVDIVLEEDDVCIGLDLKYKKGATGWKEDINVIFE